MPSIAVGSLNIDTFSFSVKFDIYNRTVIFTDTSIYNNISGQGSLYVQSIAFSLIDGDGVELAIIDWTAPQLPTPATQSIYILDLSYVNFAFLFQKGYQITGAIKDADGTVYTTIPVYKDICQPIGITESGYVPGMFQITPDCINNILTVKELTLLIYNNERPTTVTKNGTLYYPTGTISPLTFTNTPFSNDVIFTGDHNIKCTTVGTYDLGDEVSVSVSYITNQNFPIVCGNFLGDVSCCLSDVYNTYLKNCDNAIGQAALQKYNATLPAILNGLVKQINGQDASLEVTQIKKQLSCNCGSTSLGQNEVTPVNPAVNSIVLIGVGGTTIPSATITGNTKTYNIASNVVQVVKGDTGDLSYTIAIDTSVTNIVKYKLTFNKNIEAGYILDAIGGNPTLLTQLNSLITFTNFNIDLSNLNGECVIDISSVNYFFSFKVPSGTALFKNITINNTVHTPGSPIAVSDADGIAAYLNGLVLGSFDVSFSNAITGAYINILSDNNANTVNSATLTISGSDTVIPFQKTVKSLIAVLQAIIDYLCNLTSLQVALGNSLALCTLDYNSQIVTTNYTALQSQGLFNEGLASAICNLANRISTLTGITCAKIQALFQDYPNASFGVNDRILSIINGNCTSATDLQIANMVIGAINKYASTKASFCAINCNVIPTCPEINNINLAMSGSNIGLYAVGFSFSPLASQIVTVKYRVNGTTTWLIAINALQILPNGNINGTTPFLITGVSANTTYQVQVVNNCGGVGFINQITTPTGGVYSGSYLVGNIVYNVCGSSPVTLYSNAPFGTGVTMFTDAGLSTPLTGDTYIASVINGNLFSINPSNGVVGTSTGLSCFSGTSNNVKLGNDTSTVCASSPVTLYTNGVFATGLTLFIDSSLTTAQTGYSYVVSPSGTIFNVNSSTGVIGSSTGLSCTVATFDLNMSANPPGANLMVSSATINSISATPPSGVTYPILGGQNVALTSSQLGTYNISVDFIISSVPAGHSITVTLIDSGGNTVIQAGYSGAGTYNITQGAGIINTSTPVSFNVSYV